MTSMTSVSETVAPPLPPPSAFLNCPTRPALRISLKSILERRQQQVANGSRNASAEELHLLFGNGGGMRGSGVSSSGAGGLLSVPPLGTSSSVAAAANTEPSRGTAKGTLREALQRNQQRLGIVPPPEHAKAVGEEEEDDVQDVDDAVDEDAIRTHHHQHLDPTRTHKRPHQDTVTKNALFDGFASSTSINSSRSSVVTSKPMPSANRFLSLLDGPDAFQHSSKSTHSGGSAVEATSSTTTKGPSSTKAPKPSDHDRILAGQSAPDLSTGRRVVEPRSNSLFDELLSDATTLTSRSNHHKGNASSNKRDAGERQLTALLEVEGMDHGESLQGSRLGRGSGRGSGSGLTNAAAYRLAEHHHRLQELWRRWIQRHPSGGPLMLRVSIEAVDVAFGVASVVVKVVEAAEQVAQVFETANVPCTPGTSLVLVSSLSIYRDAQLYVGSMALIGSPFVLLRASHTALSTAALGAEGVVVLLSISNGTVRGALHADDKSGGGGAGSAVEAEPFRYGPLMEEGMKHATIEVGGGRRRIQETSTSAASPGRGESGKGRSTAATTTYFPPLLDTAWYVPVELVESLHERYQQEESALHEEALLQQTMHNGGRDELDEDDDVDVLDSQT